MCVAHWVSPSHGYGFRCLVIEISGTYLVTFFVPERLIPVKQPQLRRRLVDQQLQLKMQQFRKLQLHFWELDVPLFCCFNWRLYYDLCLWSIILLYSMWFYLPCKAVSLGLNLKCFVFLPLCACAIFWCNNIFSKLIIHSGFFFEVQTWILDLIQFSDKLPSSE